MQSVVYDLERELVHTITGCRNLDEALRITRALAVDKSAPLILSIDGEDWLVGTMGQCERYYGIGFGSESPKG